MHTSVRKLLDGSEVRIHHHGDWSGKAIVVIADVEHEIPAMLLDKGQDDEAIVTLATRLNKLADDNRRLRADLERTSNELSVVRSVIAGWNVAWEPPPGFVSGRACEILQAHANATKAYQSMNFNGVKVTAEPDGKAEDVYAKWEKEMSILRAGEERVTR